jgi:predicted nucleic acid-binding protein
MARNGLIQLDLSNSIPEESGGVLRDKFHWLEEDIELAQREIALFSNHVSPHKTLTVVPADDDDNRIVECATSALSDYLVTGDKHLMRLGSHGRTRIVKPAEFWRWSGAAGSKGYRRTTCCPDVECANGLGQVAKSVFLFRRAPFGNSSVKR